jgi:branched-subunit amino acid transport protein
MLLFVKHVAGKWMVHVLKNVKLIQLNALMMAQVIIRKKPMAMTREKG